MTIALAADHAGYALKQDLLARMTEAGYDVADFGTNSPARVDYIDYTLAVVAAMAAGRCDRAVFVCGNGFAMAMLANRFPGMRAAVCHDVFTARTCRQMGNANIISLGARVLGSELAWTLTQTWLEAEFLGDTVPRYARRQQQVAAVEARFARGDWQTQLQQYLDETEKN